MKFIRMMKKPKVILVPYPAQGHVTPMLHLASALYDRGFEPIIVVPAFVYRRIVSKFENNDEISLMSIPDGLDDEENQTYDFFSINYSMENHMPIHLDLIIRSLQEDGSSVCLVGDLLASWAIQVAVSRHVPVAGFWPAMFATYKLIAAIPDMIKHGYISEFGIPQHQGNMCFLPGQPALTTSHLPWLIGNHASQKARFMFWLRTLERSRDLQWLLVNSFMEESNDSCNDNHHHHQQLNDNGLIERLAGGPRVFEVGPLTDPTKITKNPSFWDEDRSCLDWLDKQKKSSVIYVSFGSWVGPIGEEKVRELALGLESTKSPFIWVLGSTWRNGLPAGFLDRVTNVGKIVSWAPQKEILQHVAIGCYLTHCGWNSTMEAMQCGKKLLCYPVGGDQFVNCTYIVDVWGIGVKMDHIRKSDVEEGVKRVLEGGCDMEERVMKMKVKLTGEEGSLRAICSLKDFIDQINKSIVIDSPTTYCTNFK